MTQGNFIVKILRKTFKVHIRGIHVFKKITPGLRRYITSLDSDSFNTYR